MTNHREEFLPTRESLIHRLKDLDDQESWREFFETYWHLIYSLCRKAGLSDAEAQDTVQETVVSVMHKMEGFTYDPAKGSFKAWLKRLTQWRISDQFRKKHYQKQGKQYSKEIALSPTALEEYLNDQSFDFEQAWEEEWQRNLFELALRKIKNDVPALTFQMFHLHVIKDIEAKTIAQQLGVKLAEVYSAKYKVSKLVEKEVKELRRKLH